MPGKIRLNNWECFSHLNQLDDSCRDDGVRNGSNFSNSSGNEIVEQSSNSTGAEIDPDYSSVKETSGCSGNLHGPDGM